MERDMREDLAAVLDEVIFLQNRMESVERRLDLLNGRLEAFERRLSSFE